MTGYSVNGSDGYREPDSAQHVYLLIAVALDICRIILLPVSQNFTRLAPTLSLIECYAASSIA